MLDAMQLEAIDGISYVTDVGGTITGVGARRWDAFAAANGAHELTGGSVVGRNLFEFVAGADNSAHLRRVMRQLAVGAEEAWIMPFRCDGPGRERSMRLSLTPFRAGAACTGFLFQSIELSIDQRPPIELFDFKALERLAADRADLPLVVICSWCQKVRYPPLTGEIWVEAERYYAAGGSSRARISHGICPSCAATVDRGFRSREA